MGAKKPQTATNGTIETCRPGLPLRINADVALAAGLSSGDQITIEVASGKIVIRPLGERPRSLAEKLEAFDPVRHGSEAMAFSPIGREVFDS